MNKLTGSVVAIFVNAATKNFANALIPAIIMCHRCLLSKKKCENISNLQMPISHAKVVQTRQLRCFLIS